MSTLSIIGTMGDSEIAGIQDVSSVPKWEATGDCEIRARRVNKRHLKILNDLEVELGGVGRREAIAALLEYYYKNPQEVKSGVEKTEFR